MRIGVVAGALLGVVVALILGSGVGWWIVSTGVVGGAIGYRWGSHESVGDPPDSEPLGGRRR